MFFAGPRKKWIRTVVTVLAATGILIVAFLLMDRAIAAFLTGA